jgi:hypothetical protein
MLVVVEMEQLSEKTQGLAPASYLIRWPRTKPDKHRYAGHSCCLHWLQF